MFTVGRDDLIPPEAVEKLTFSGSLSIETTLSIEFRRKIAPYILAIRQHELTQHYPHEGWVEQDPMEIWSTQHAAMLEALAAADVR